MTCLTTLTSPTNSIDLTTSKNPGKEAVAITSSQLPATTKKGVAE